MRHLVHRGKNRLEVWATVSGVFIAVVLPGYVAAELERTRFDS